MVCRVESNVTEHAADGRQVDTGGHHLDSHGVAERVWVDVLPLQGRQFLACGLDILCKLEPDSGSTQGPAVAIDEQRLMIGSGLSFEQRDQQLSRLRPDWSEPLFAALAVQPDMIGRGAAEHTLVQFEACVRTLLAEAREALQQ